MIYIIYYHSMSKDISINLTTEAMPKKAQKAAKNLPVILSSQATNIIIIKMEGETRRPCS